MILYLLTLTCCSAVLQLSAATTVCGKQGLLMRIYGGSSSVPGEWPWHAALSHMGKPICGGSLISDRWILSAAHCFNGNLTLKDPKSWTVHLGFSKLGGSPETSAVSMVPSRILIHGNFMRAIYGQDLALIELPKPVTLTRFISPICLPEKTHRFRLRRTCWTTGLEDVPEGVPLDSKRSLEKVSQTLIGGRTCNCIYNSHKRPELADPTKPGMLCTLDRDGEKGPCLGDSGGPVVCNEDGVWFIAGIISFSAGCHLKDSPTIITNVSFYQDWIQKITDHSVAFTAQNITVTDDIDNDYCSDLLSTKNPGCGMPTIQDDNPSTPGVWPWQVDLRRDGRRMCGGTLISANWVITSANCFIGTFSSDFPFEWSVVVAPGTPAMRESPVQSVSMHGAYIMPKWGKNVALVQLLRPATLGPYTQPACLPQASHSLSYGSTCWHTGWDGPHPDGIVRPPQAVEQELVGPNECNCIYSQLNTINQSVSILPDMACARDKEGSQCLSDHGGPLVCKENSTWFLVGVRSFGGECEKKKEGITTPGVYTRLSAYEDWISSLTQEVVFNQQLWTPPTELGSGRCSYSSSRGCGRSVTSPGPTPIGEANVGTWPWQVSIQQYSYHACSGVLIAETWVLTTAHCVSSPMFPRYSSVFLGKHSQDGENPHEVERRIKRIVTHPGYSRTSGDNDLALVELNFGVTYSDYIMPICLPPPSSPHPPSKGCWVTGWGNLHPSGDRLFFPPLRELAVSVLDGKKCGAQTQRNQSGELQICAAVQSKRTFTCLEESSSPLVCQLQSGDPWYVYGIGSYFSAAEDYTCPANYTSVSPHVSWIREVVPQSNLNSWETCGLLGVCVQLGIQVGVTINGELEALLSMTRSRKDRPLN
ncbi:serine protease 53 [Discoglossus pictus]